MDTDAIQTFCEINTDQFSAYNSWGGVGAVHLAINEQSHPDLFDIGSSDLEWRIRFVMVYDSQTSIDSIAGDAMQLSYTEQFFEITANGNTQPTAVINYHNGNGFYLNAQSETDVDFNWGDSSQQIFEGAWFRTMWMGFLTTQINFDPNQNTWNGMEFIIAPITIKNTTTQLEYDVHRHIDGASNSSPMAFRIQYDGFKTVGDVNSDNSYNVLDIVALANCVLAQSCEGCEGDLNGDSSFNVLDIVALAHCVLNQNCGDNGDCSDLF